MVVSRLNKNITYPELKRLEKDDALKKSVLYELEIENARIPKVNIVIALGCVKRNYETYNPGVIYFPIYFVTKKKTAIQIGVYEILKNELYKFINKEDDDDQDIKNYHLFDTPLLWSWIDNSFIVNYRLPPIVVESKDETEDEEDSDDDGDGYNNNNGKNNNNIQKGGSSAEYVIPVYRADIFTLMRDVRAPEKLKEETQETSSLIKRENDLNWISKFMKNENYDISDKDNFFHAIQSAFEQIGQQTYEKKLRKKLSESKYIESYFHRQKMKYNESVKYYQQIQKKMEIEERKKEEYKKELKQKKANATKLQDFEIKEYNRMKKEIELLTIQKEELKTLKREFEYMKPIDTVDQMKDYIMAKNYTIDDFSLLLLEKLLKLKIILFLEDANRENDLKGSIDCGVKDETFHKFQPEYYMLLEYSELKNKYSLVSYKHKRIFTFRELPYDLKNIISYKCIEHVEGNFSQIPEWVHYHTEVKKRGDIIRDDIYAEDVVVSGIMRKYDGVKILIYCPSSHKKMPGTVRGEIMPFEKKIEYMLLSTINNWRCILDNNWVGTDADERGLLKAYQYELNGYYWASIQHYIQACKFKEEHPEYYSKFALGVLGSDIMIEVMDRHTNEMSKNVELAIFLGTKSAGKLFKGEHGGGNGYKREKSIQIDKSYNEQSESRNLKDALYAKFSQNPTYKKVLISTNNSLLVYAPLKKSEYHAEELMYVRDTIMSNDNNK